MKPGYLLTLVLLALFTIRAFDLNFLEAFAVGVLYGAFLAFIDWFWGEFQRRYRIERAKGND